MAETAHEIVPHAEWIKARKELLVKEKEYTRLGDELARRRRELPWERVTKDYLFDGPAGKETLSQLFAGHSQLAVYHFMFNPEWEEGCPHCSFWADNFDGIDIHLAHRDVAFVAISHAPLSKLEAFKQRMGWSFKWVSAGENGFNYDYYVSFRPEEMAKGEIFHNYETTKQVMSEHAGANAIAIGAGPRNRVSEAVAQRCGGDKAEVVARLAWRAEPPSRPVPIARRGEGDRRRVVSQLVDQIG